MAENPNEVRCDNSPRMETTGANFMKLKGQILEMI